MVITFLVILWFQNNDDIKNKRIRVSLFEKYKLPLLVSAIIGLILHFPILFKINEITEIKGLSNSNITIVSELPSVIDNSISKYNIKDIINNLQISTDLPDF